MTSLGLKKVKRFADRKLPTGELKIWCLRILETFKQGHLCIWLKWSWIFQTAEKKKKMSFIYIPLNIYSTHKTINSNNKNWYEHGHRCIATQTHLLGTIYCQFTIIPMPIRESRHIHNTGVFIPLLGAHKRRKLLTALLMCTTDTLLSQKWCVKVYPFIGIAFHLVAMITCQLLTWRQVISVRLATVTLQ